MKHEVVLQKFLGSDDPDGRAKLRKALEKANVVRRIDGDEEIDAHCVTRLSMKSNRDSSDDEVPNLGGVECRQQFDPIF